MTYPHLPLVYQSGPEGLPLMEARDGDGVPELPETPFHWIQPNVGLKLPRG